MLVSAFPKVYPNIQFKFSALETGAVNVWWSYEDASGKRAIFEVPQDIVNTQMHGMSKDNKLSDFIVLGSSPLMQVKNKAGTVVYELNSLILVDYLNIISGRAKTYVGNSADNFKGIMGLAEKVVTNLFLPDGIYTLWSRDIPSPPEDGKLPGKNVYGVHPFYMARAQDQSWFGVYTNLAAAQDWWIKNNAQSGDVDISTYAAGGLGDVTFMFGATPDSISAQYQNNIVGNPVLVPQWALGWNHCKYGYNNASEVNSTVQGYAQYKIPLDNQWVDIDYLDNYEDFTYDNVNFGTLPDLVNELHSKNMHFVPIIDAGIAKIDGSKAYDEGKQDDVFIKAYDNKTDFVGTVWPGDAVFPDWSKNDTSVSWW